MKKEHFVNIFSGGHQETCLSAWLWVKRRSPIYSQTILVPVRSQADQANQFSSGSGSTIALVNVVHLCSLALDLVINHHVHVCTLLVHLF